MKNVFIVCLLSIFLNSCNAQKSIKYAGIDRTLSLLQNSTKESPNNVDILFYGQSIIGGMKTNILVDSLRNLYPNTNITYKHKPIGGFAVPDLIRTSEHDIYHENPDLIIFHAYDGIKDGLYDSLIKRIRQKMPSDIILLNHHYAWNKPEDLLESINKSHEFDSEAIKKIAKKYSCGFIDVRKKWKYFLEKNNIKANKLVGNTVKPDVHPNAKGNKLLREIILSEFKNSPILKYNPAKDAQRNIIPVNAQTYPIKTSFFGNRLELYMQSQEEKKPTIIEPLIDGKKPSQFRSSYYITRPSKGFESFMPAIKNISFGKSFPREEEWELIITEIDRVNKTFKYSLSGSLTGFDGKGTSGSDYVSNSQRIKIKKEDFHIFHIEKITKKETPVNFKINFSVRAIVKDKILIRQEASKCIIFNDVSPKKHHLELNIIKGNRKVEKLVAISPFLEANE